MIYLDYAAATPVDERVLAVMEPYWREKFYNPSALYDAARTTKRELQDARAGVAARLQAKQQEVFFTAGATEANNLAIAGVARRYPHGNIIISTIEHESVRSVAFASGETRQVTPEADGVVSVETITDAIDEQTVLISLDYVNSEIGTIQPIRHIAKAVDRIRALRREAGNTLPLYVHTDASQALECLGMDVAALGVDMATINIAKLYGPKQCGVLYKHRSVELEPLIYGGGQERGLRSGTENVGSAVAAAKALELTETERPQRLKQYRQQFQQLRAVADDIPGAQLNGSEEQRVPTNVNLSFEGVDGETLVHHLNTHGILAATGAACSANNDTPSHVLSALGLSEPHITGSLRMSLGRETSDADIARVTEVLKELTTELRSR